TMCRGHIAARSYFSKAPRWADRAADVAAPPALPLLRANSRSAGVKPKELVQAAPGQALTRAPMGPWPRPCARLTPMVATISMPKHHPCKGWYRLAAPAGVE